MSKHLITLVLLCILFCACGGRNGAKNGGHTAGKLREFSIPIPPAMVTDPQQRAEYLSRHYWDQFDFADTTDISHPEFLEQNFVNYVNMLQHADPKVAAESVREMTPKTLANPDMQRAFADLFEKYLYDPNSPMRDEELYIPYLETIVASPDVEEDNKIRPRHQLAMALKNRLDTKALNFTYTTAPGQKSTLYDLHADYVLLFINNPGCPACKDFISQLEASPLITEMVRTGMMKILALYPDADLEEWRAYRSHIPASWINAYDAGTVIKQQELYDLKAIPTSYLLDRNKIVLLKDCTSVALIEDVLRER